LAVLWVILYEVPKIVFESVRLCPWSVP